MKKPQKKVYCANGKMCKLPDASRGIEFAANQALVVNRLQSLKPTTPIMVYDQARFTYDAKRPGSGVVRIDKQLYVKGRDILAELDKRQAGLSSSGPSGKKKGPSKTEVKMKGPTLTNPKGRLNINARGPLYLMAQDGVVVSKEWRGTGSLRVEGELCVGDVCFNAEEWRQIKKLLQSAPVPAPGIE